MVKERKIIHLLIVFLFMVLGKEFVYVSISNNQAVSINAQYNDEDGATLCTKCKLNVTLTGVCGTCAPYGVCPLCKAILTDPVECNNCEPDDSYGCHRCSYGCGRCADVCNHMCQTCPWTCGTPFCNGGCQNQPTICSICNREPCECSSGGTGGSDPGDPDPTTCDCCTKPIEQCDCNKCPDCHKLLPDESQAMLKSTNAACLICECSEDDTNVSITANNPNPLIGDEYELTITTTGTETQVSHIIVNASSSCGLSGIVIDEPTTNKTFTESLRAMHGSHKIYTATVTYTWRGIQKARLVVCSVLERFHNRQELLTNFGVEISNLWGQTVSYCLTNNTQTEYYLLMMRYSDTDIINASAWGNGSGKSSDFSCGTRAEFTSNYTHLDPSSIKSGGKFLVGQFHTHPPLQQCNNSNTLYSRAVGPSQDKDIPNINGVPCFVYDYEGINGFIDSNHSAYDDARIYNYGPNQRSGR